MTVQAIIKVFISWLRIISDILDSDLHWIILKVKFGNKSVQKFERERVRDKLFGP